MNRLTMNLVSAIAACSMIACGNVDERAKTGGYESIVNSPAFAGITDSINRSPEDVQLILTRAMRLSQQNFHKAASTDYEKAYRITADDGVALEYASSLLLANEAKRAIQVLEDGTVKFPENSEFSRRLAEIYLQNGDSRKALREYDRMLSIDSTNFEALFDKGNLLAKLRDTAAAIDALERSFAILPINLSGMALANIYVAQKNPRALQICDVILGRDTSAVLTEPIYMKGVYYSETGEHEKAIAQFDECIRRDWKMTDAYIEKGIILFEQQKTSDALSVFNLAAKVSNTDADVYFWIGRCFEQQGKRDEAITNYRRALALDETFNEARAAIDRLNS